MKRVARLLFCAGTLLHNIAIALHGERIDIGPKVADHGLDNTDSPIPVLSDAVEFKRPRATQRGKRIKAVS